MEDLNKTALVTEDMGFESYAGKTKRVSKAAKFSFQTTTRNADVYHQFDATAFSHGIKNNPKKGISVLSACFIIFLGLCLMVLSALPVFLFSLSVIKLILAISGIVFGFIACCGGSAYLVKILINYNSEKSFKVDKVMLTIIDRSANTEEKQNNDILQTTEVELPAKTDFNFSNFGDRLQNIMKKNMHLLRAKEKIKEKFFDDGGEGALKSSEILSKIQIGEKFVGDCNQVDFNSGLSDHITTGRTLQLTVSV